MTETVLCPRILRRVMKEIAAYIKPIKLSDVTQALHHLDGLNQVNIVNKVQELGWRKSEDTPYRGVEDGIEEVSHLEVKIYCEDDQVEEVVSTIQKAAHTGLRGDGNIYVSPIEQSVRIKTGERS